MSHQITWDIDVPLIKNAYMLRSMLKVTLGSGVMVGTLVSFLMAVQGDWTLVPPMMGIFFAAGIGFFVVSVVIMRVLFGSRLRMRFSVSADGIRGQTLDRVARAGARGALLAGAVSARPGVAGSGLVSTTQEGQTLNWSGAFRMVSDPARRTLALSNRWRTLMMVYCTPENFERVESFVTHRMMMHGTAGRSAGKSPVGPCVQRTILSVLVCTPIFLLGEVYGYGLFPPLLLMCFAIATVWMVRQLAWVVLGCSAWVGASIVNGALVVRASSFFKGQSYRRYEALSGDDRALTALAAGGLIYLVWAATQVLRGRTQPALEADLADGQGE